MNVITGVNVTGDELFTSVNDTRDYSFFTDFQ
jgi:hypothetical protein